MVFTFRNDTKWEFSSQLFSDGNQRGHMNISKMSVQMDIRKVLRVFEIFEKFHRQNPCRICFELIFFRRDKKSTTFVSSKNKIKHNWNVPLQINSSCSIISEREKIIYRCQVVIWAYRNKRIFRVGGAENFSLVRTGKILVFFPIWIEKLFVFASACSRALHACLHVKMPKNFSLHAFIKKVSMKCTRMVCVLRQVVPLFFCNVHFFLFRTN